MRFSAALLRRASPPRFSAALPRCASPLRFPFAARQAENPRLIYASSSGYGPRGPWAHLGAFDMATQASFTVRCGRDHS